MNEIPACIIDIQNCDVLNIVSFEFLDYKMAMMSLELEDVNVGDRAILTVKPSSVAIGKRFVGELSYSNQLKGYIKNIENGELLSYLEVKVGDIFIQSVITKKSALRMDLKQNDEVICIIKASDLSILEIKK